MQNLIFQTFSGGGFVGFFSTFRSDYDERYHLDVEDDSDCSGVVGLVNPVDLPNIKPAS